MISRGPRTAQAVLKAISRPYRLPNLVEVNLSCSIGIVTYPALRFVAGRQTVDAVVFPLDGIRQAPSST